jgi:hypothetical protein
MVQYCQPARWLSGCWAGIVGTPRPHVSPLLWSSLRQTIRSLTKRSKVGSYPSTGAVALWIALQLCEHVSLFGFGNGTWDCHRGGFDCARYDALPLHLRLGCTKWKVSPIDEYISTAFHDFPAEWDWVGQLIESGAVRVPSCGRGS